MASIAHKAGLDPTLPDVSLTIGGKERKLAYDFTAIVTAERLTGVNLLKAAMSVVPFFGEIRGMLYAALLKDEPTLTLDELDTWPLIWNIGTIQEAIRDAWFGSVPESKDDQPGKAVAQIP